jgi:hypothetical protein
VYIPGGDDTTHAFAGFTTGLFYKSTAGVRGALLAATIGSVVSVAYSNGSAMLYNYLNRGSGRF